MHKGSCLCGAVSYEVRGPLTNVSACHCTQCRKMSGHYWASAQASEDDLQIERGEALTWYRSSDWAERGFCNRCGSFLFWRMSGEGKTSVALGSLDNPTGLRIEKHIFVADKGDYYDIEPGPVQLDTF